MRTGALIYPLLANFAGLTAIVAANKIFALRAQQPTNAPYITYRQISSQPTNTKGDSTDINADPRIKQRSTIDVNTIQVSCFADTYLEVENIAVEVRKALDREWGAADAPYAADIELDSCIYDSCVDDFDDDFGANGIYIKHLDFTCRVNRIDISN